MARINIEDSIYKDLRFIDLVGKLQSIDTAIGSLVRAWSLAQKFYTSRDRFIPFEEWQKQRLREEIIEVGLATRIDAFVKMAGIDDQFKWLLQRQIAGQKGGLKRGENLKRPLHSANGSKPPTPTPTPTPTLPLSPTLLDLNTNTLKPKRPLRNAQTGLSELDEQLSSIYSEYPRKVGKEAGFKSLKKTLKSQTDIDGLRTAVRRFKANCEAKRTKKDYIPYFSTFANNWRDYLEADFGDNSGSTELDFSGIDE